MLAREGETQLRGVQPLSSRQAETHLRGVHPLPARQGKIQLRVVQSGMRGSAEFKADQARGEFTRDQTGARDQARAQAVHHPRLFRHRRVNKGKNVYVASKCEVGANNRM